MILFDHARYSYIPVSYTHLDNNKRIAKNILLLYIRMLFMMIVSLYTSRVILDALGVEDFGIYTVSYTHLFVLGRSTLSAL